MDSTNIKFWLNMLLMQCIGLAKECLKYTDRFYAQLKTKATIPSSTEHRMYKRCERQRLAVVLYLANRLDVKYVLYKAQLTQKYGW
jgi:hypothetical protein